MNFTCVCFGEVLFDVLPNEVKAGGSPMNVAYHLTTLDQPATLISRIGNDLRGQELKAILEKKKVNLDYLQVDESHPTGIVLAQPNAAGDMQYQIKEGAAWDFIELKPAHELLVKNAGYLIFGSLITRSTVPRNTLFNLLDIPATRVLDVNLRPPFVTQATLEYQLNKADILKMNEEELDTIAGWYINFKTIEDKVRFLQNRFDIPVIIITRGAKGAILNSNDNFFYQEGYRVTVADTIGSGDSFVAGYLNSIINHNKPEQALQFASALGAFVATQTGGCPSYTVNDIQSFILSKSSINA